MAKNRGKWEKVGTVGKSGKSGEKWRKVARCGYVWFYVAKSGFVRLKVVLCGSKWLNMGTIGLFSPTLPHLNSPQHTPAFPQKKIHERFMI